MLAVTPTSFVEDQRERGHLFIEQPYHLYTPAHHETWRTLYDRMVPLWDRWATSQFMEGLQALHLNSGSIPRLEDINQFLSSRTGFAAKPVSGYVPAYIFFDCLRRREFPTTITIRSQNSLDYLPEPDIFHDVCGHVPMHTDPAFAAALVRFGECARTAATRGPNIESVMKALARFFWFTVEFGLLQTPNGLKACGSGLLSSHGELEHSIESPDVQRSPVQLDWIIHQSFEIDHFQPLLFVMEGFDQLYNLIEELESWLLAGRLDHVAPGEPVINLRDVESFLHAHH